MKKKTEQPSDTPDFLDWLGPRLLLFVLLAAAGFVLYWPAKSLIIKLTAKPAPQYETCVKCSHLFKPGTGKHTVTYSDELQRDVTNSYCATDAPKWDRSNTLHFWGAPSQTAYWAPQSPWKRVNEDGSEYNPHKCPEPVTNTVTVAKECDREHWPALKHWPLDSTMFITNIYHGNTNIFIQSK